MSYILDALMRAQQERKNDPLVTVTEPSSRQPPADARTLSWSRYGWITAVILLLAGFAFQMVSSQDAATEVPAAITAAQPDSLSRMTDDAAPDSLAELADESAADYPESSVGPLPSLQDMRLSMFLQNPPDSTEPPAAMPQPESLPESDLELPIETEPMLRSLKDMPADFRAQFPALTVEVHVYDAKPALRFTRIDGQRYKEGDTLPGGPQIESINEAGIVFRFRGERVLLPSGG